MNTNQERIKELLSNLENADDYEAMPATSEQIETFIKIATEKQVPQSVIAQLTELYEVANNYSYEIIMAFHCCTDEIIFEFWDDKRELWLGQRDYNMLRWADGKFCLGDASNSSFGKEYEVETLIQLIEICVKEIEAADYFGEE